jgi:hypothetical protein
MINVVEKPYDETGSFLRKYIFPVIFLEQCLSKYLGGGYIYIDLPPV